MCSIITDKLGVRSLCFLVKNTYIYVYVFMYAYMCIYVSLIKNGDISKILIIADNLYKGF